MASIYLYYVRVPAIYIEKQTLSSWKSYSDVNISILLLCKYVMQLFTRIFFCKYEFRMKLNFESVTFERHISWKILRNTQ